MGVDWYPFQLKPKTIKDDFETMILQQRDFYLANDWQNRNDCPVLEPLVEFGRNEDLPEYIDSIRICPIGEHPLFPKVWRNDLYKTYFPAEADRVVRKRLDWVNLLRKGELPALLKLRYLEQTNDDLNSTWSKLQDSVSCVRKRKNNWACKDSTISACEHLESLVPPHKFLKPCFDSYWKAWDDIPWIDPICSQNLDDILDEAKQSVQEFMMAVHNWNRIVKTERCHCNATDFETFKQKMYDSYLDEFFIWTKKWIDRGYGMFLSF